MLRPEIGQGAEGSRLPDREAFEAIFLEQYPGVFRLLFRLTGSRADAEDLAQETFLRCYRRMPEEPGTGVRPWLYRVALNLGYNAARDRRRRREGHERAGREPRTAGAGLDPGEDLTREEERLRVRRALEELPPRQSQMLLLRYAGLSYRELAGALSMSPASVGTLLHRAEEAFERAYRPRERESAKGVYGHV